MLHLFISCSMEESKGDGHGDLGGSGSVSRIQTALWGEPSHYFPCTCIRNNGVYWHRVYTQSISIRLRQTQTSPVKAFITTVRGLGIRQLRLLGAPCAVPVASWGVLLAFPDIRLIQSTEHETEAYVNKAQCLVDGSFSRRSLSYCPWTCMER